MKLWGFTWFDCDPFQIFDSCYPLDLYTCKEKQTNGFVFSDLLLKKQEPVLVDTKIKEKAFKDIWCISTTHSYPFVKTLSFSVLGFCLCFPFFCCWWSLSGRPNYWLLLLRMGWVNLAFTYKILSWLVLLFFTLDFGVLLCLWGCWWFLWFACLWELLWAYKDWTFVS